MLKRIVRHIHRRLGHRPAGHVERLPQLDEHGAALRHPIKMGRTDKTRMPCQIFPADIRKQPFSGGPITCVASAGTQCSTLC